MSYYVCRRLQRTNGNDKWQINVLNPANLSHVEIGNFSPTFPKMSEVAVLQAYRVVLVIETTFICIGNAFTVFVFWNQRHYLKRASSLLINLAVADFLVGARELIDTLVNYNDRMMFAQGDKPLIISATLFSSVSVFSLLVISLCVQLKHKIENSSKTT